MVKSTFFEGTDFQFKVHFNLKGDADKMGRKAIRLITYIGGERVVIPLGMKVEEKYWIKRDERHPYEKAKIDTESTPLQQKNSKAINEMIDKVLYYCHDYADMVCMVEKESDTPLEHSKQSFLEFMNKKMNDVKHLNQARTFINNYIDHKAVTVDRHTQRIPTKGTIDNHRTALKRLEDFCKDKGRSLAWRLFNDEFEADFHTWAINLSKPYSKQTVCSTLADIKCWLNAAERKGVKVPNAFKEWKTKCKAENEDNGVYLTDEELARIGEIDFNDESVRKQLPNNMDFGRLEQTRDLFIIAAHTSLRYGDWSENLHKAELVEGNVMKIKNNKTQKYVHCLYSDKIKSMVEKYGGFDKLPIPPCLSTAERYVRICAKLAGVKDYEKVGTHTARRSFVTNHIAKGCRMDAVAAATGHTTSTLVQLYNKSSVIDRARSLVS